MTRVCPQPEEILECPDTHEDVPPNTRYKDMAQGQDRHILLNFESFCDEDGGGAGEDMLVEGAEEDGVLGGGDERKARRSSGERKKKKKHKAPRSHSDKVRRHHQAPSGKEKRESEPQVAASFCQCDGVAILILAAYLLAAGVLALTVFCYMQDNMWNKIVRREMPFPVIEGEPFFKDKYLYMYETSDPKLQNAKDFLLREYRVWEWIHPAFFGCFLLFTLIQFGLYVTRGKEDHSKVVTAYYGFFGVVGAIVALIPFFSWKEEKSDYREAAKALREYSKQNSDSSDGADATKSATAADARTLAGIAETCDMAMFNLNSLESHNHHYHYNYHINELQVLGFCTHHKYKMISVILGLAFAFVCCVIPCIYCFGSGGKKPEKVAKPPPKAVHPLPPQPPVKKEHRSSRQRKRPRSADLESQPVQVSQPMPVSQPKPRKHSENRRRSSSKEACMDELKKFKRYVEGPSDDDTFF